jgi:hypothetical protein
VGAKDWPCAEGASAEEGDDKHRDRDLHLPRIKDKRVKMFGRRAWPAGTLFPHKGKQLEGVGYLD